MPLESLIHRFTRLLAVLLGLVPFINPWRWPPEPAVWEEWATCLVACLWLVAVGWQQRQAGRPVRIGGVAAILLGLALLTAAQAAAGLAAQPLTALLVALVLLLAARLNLTLGAADAAHRSQWLRDWALGILLALYANGAGELLGLAGFEWLGWQIVPSIHPPRAIGLQGQSNQLADLTVFAMAAALLRFKPGRWTWAALLLHVAAAAALCGATASRSGMAGWLVGGVIAGWLLHRHPAQPLGAGRLAVFGLAALLPLVLAQAWPQTGVGVSVLRTSTAGRGDMLLGAWQLWLSHPLFGVGYGGYAGARYFELDGPLYSPNSTHAHNLLAQVAAEWGTVGLLALLLPVAGTLWRRRAALSGLWRHGPTGGERGLHNGVILIAWTTALIHSQVELPLWFCYYLLPLALLAGAWRHAEPGDATSTPSTSSTPSVVDGRIADTPTPAGGAPSRLWVGGLAGLALTGLIGWDYHRLQVQALDMMGLRGGRAPLSAQATLERAGRISALTAFPTYAELMYVRAIGHDAMLAPLSLDIAQRVVRALPSAETITHYLIALALLDRTDEATRLLQAMKGRNERVYVEILARLTLARGEAPVVSVLLEASADRP